MRYLIPMLIFLAFMPPIHADVDPVRVSPVVRALGQAGPAVVNISTEKVVSVTGANPFGDEWIFNYFEPSRRRNITNQSLGSGTIIQPDGIILTNEHIILPPRRSPSRSRRGRNMKPNYWEPPAASTWHSSR